MKKTTQKQTKKNKVSKKLEKLKEIQINKFHLILGLVIAILVFLSYSFIGQIDTSQSALEETESITIPILNIEIDFKTTSLLLASIIIGLLDGFNPCAMWVLIYLISLATSIGDRKKLYFIVGTFVVTEAIMYFLVLAGWLNLFMFIGISSWILYLVGAFAIWTGIMSINNYIKTGGEVTCEIGDMESKKKTMSKIDNIINSPITLASLGAVFLLAIVVNSIEFVCSAGLPAIFTQMLAIADVSVFMKYVYILIYDFFFMLDDFIIFGLAIWALNSDWTTKYSGFSKLFGGIIMLLIGIMLLFFPNILF